MKKSIKKQNTTELVDNTKNDTKVLPTVAQAPIEDDSSFSLRTAELDFDTEVYDDGDIASALEIGFIAKALEMHKLKVAPETHPDFDGTHCIDCEDEIPKLRLEMHKIRCVYCQEELEKKKKLGRA